MSERSSILTLIPALTPSLASAALGVLRGRVGVPGPAAPPPPVGGHDARASGLASFIPIWCLMPEGFHVLQHTVWKTMVGIIPPPPAHTPSMVSQPFKCVQFSSI